MAEFSNELKLAGVAALSALAGTLAGGLISYYASRDLQDREFERSTQIRLEAARAAAAVERNRLVIASRTVRTMSEQGLYYVDANPDAEIAIADRQLVIGYLRAREIDAYADARMCVGQLTAELEGKRTGDTINEFAMSRLKVLDECVGSGERALRRLAELSAG